MVFSSDGSGGAATLKANLDDLQENMDGLCKALAEKSKYLGEKQQAGKVPLTSQLAGFLRETTAALTPFVMRCPVVVRENLRSGFSNIGWDVAKNAACAGAGPPTVGVVYDMLSRVTAGLKNLTLAEPTSKTAKREHKALLQRQHRGRQAERRKLRQIEDKAEDLDIANASQLDMALLITKPSFNSVKDSHGISLKKTTIVKVDNFVKSMDMLALVKATKKHGLRSVYKNCTKELAIQGETGERLVAFMQEKGIACSKPEEPHLNKETKRIEIIYAIRCHNGPWYDPQNWEKYRAKMKLLRQSPIKRKPKMKSEELRFNQRIRELERKHCEQCSSITAKQALEERPSDKVSDGPPFLPGNLSLFALGLLTAVANGAPGLFVGVWLGTRGVPLG